MDRRAISQACQSMRSGTSEFRSAYFLLFCLPGLLICSLPAPDIGWLAWVGLVPLLIACNGIASKHAAAIGFVSGFVSAFGIYNWLFQLPAFGWCHAFVLAAYVALYPALFCAALAVFNRWRAPLIFSAPTLWVAVEYLRANAGFLALPWGTLAHAQLHPTDAFFRSPQIGEMKKL